MTDRPRRGAVIAALVVGVALALAPVAFGMFTRAPQGGTMIDDFEPYMTDQKVQQFRGYLAEIGAADAESQQLRDRLVSSGAVSSADWSTKYSGVARLNEQWPAIRADMTDLLDRIDANQGNYRAVAALPPFALFPWFFVLPGLLIAGVAASILWSARKGRSVGGRLWVLAGLGLAVALAPAVFQMFGRAPQGRDMIDDFRPMMTRERVQDVQGYFVTMGGAEGQLRTSAVPLLESSGGSATEYPAIARFSKDWPGIVGNFNPMVATMSDNVDNFAAVDAMPSFALFPWFFVIPGLLVAALALVARRRSEPDHPQPDQQDSGTPQGATP